MWKSNVPTLDMEIIKQSDNANRKFWDAMNPIATDLSTALQDYLISINKFFQPLEYPNILPGIFQSK